jgi:hypothetical protein
MMPGSMIGTQCMPLEWTLPMSACSECTQGNRDHQPVKLQSAKVSAEYVIRPLSIPGTCQAGIDRVPK